ncbi:hypothetical protein EOM39_01210 [Candidatus Gracilibacteria bacterium]|nr:hypothetical protein [Candidatus Gracilibacteria bacterium]
MICQVCGKEVENISDLWEDIYCQDRWEDYCSEEYEKEINKLPKWCFQNNYGKFVKNIIIYRYQNILPSSKINKKTHTN